MGNHLAKAWVYENVNQIYDPPAGTTGDSYLNPKFPVTDPQADTEWAWLTADGSNNMDLVRPSTTTQGSLTFGGTPVTFGGDTTTY